MLIYFIFFVKSERVFELEGVRPSRFLIKVLSDPSVGLDSHQTRDVHLLDVMGGRQDDLIGVSLPTQEGMETSIKWVSCKELFQT